jgi:putative chitinase
MRTLGLLFEVDMITAKAIIQVAPAAKPYAEELAKQMAEAGIQATQKRAAMFLGQIMVESGGFASVVESLNYKADSAMMQRFIRWRRISAPDAQKFGKTPDHPANQSALANILYGGEFGREQLGNTQPGDGWKFIGRGLKQLTGRDNYRRFSRAWLGDESLLAHPERVAAADGAVASAVWFWMSRGLNEVADKGTVEAVTLKVNGGNVGLAERKTWTDAFRKKWTDQADFSGVSARVLP